MSDRSKDEWQIKSVAKHASDKHTAQMSDKHTAQVIDISIVTLHNNDKNSDPNSPKTTVTTILLIWGINTKCCIT